MDLKVIFRLLAGFSLVAQNLACSGPVVHDATARATFADLTGVYGSPLTNSRFTTSIPPTSATTPLADLLCTTNYAQCCWNYILPSNNANSAAYSWYSTNAGQTYITQVADAYFGTHAALPFAGFMAQTTSLASQPLLNSCSFCIGTATTSITVNFTLFLPTGKAQPALQAQLYNAQTASLSPISNAQAPVTLTALTSQSSTFVAQATINNLSGITQCLGSYFAVVSFSSTWQSPSALGTIANILIFKDINIFSTQLANTASSCPTVCV